MKSTPALTLKVLRTIASCRTIEQILVAKRYVELATSHVPSKRAELFLDQLASKTLTITKNSKH